MLTIQYNSVIFDESHIWDESGSYGTLIMHYSEPNTWTGVYYMFGAALKI